MYAKSRLFQPPSSPDLIRPQSRQLAITSSSTTSSYPELAYYPSISSLQFAGIQRLNRLTLLRGLPKWEQVQGASDILPGKLILEMAARRSVIELAFLVCS